MWPRAVSADHDGSDAARRMHQGGDAPGSNAGAAHPHAPWPDDAGGDVVARAPAPVPLLAAEASLIAEPRRLRARRRPAATKKSLWQIANSLRSGQAALAHQDKETAAALRADEKKFLSGLDDGFDTSVWGKSAPRPANEQRAEIGRLRRAGDSGDDPLSALEAELRDRIAFLRTRRRAISRSRGRLWW